MTDHADRGLPPAENRAVVLGLAFALVAAIGFGTWLVVHEGARVRGAAASGGANIAPMVRGEQVYGLCANCHGLGGGGQLGRAPALLGSEWLAPGALTRLVLNGYQGPDAGRYREKMAGAPALSDSDVAALVTFVGARYAGREETTTAAEVAELRPASRRRTKPWTAEQLRRALAADIGEE